MMKTRIISILLAAVMFISISAISADVFNLKTVAVKAEKPVADSGDEQVACDISNITGVKTEILLSERNKGKAWNEILEDLRQGAYEKGADSGQRENALSQSGIGESELDKLKSEGFDDDEIQQARLLVERVAFQLREITAGDTGIDTSPGVNSSVESGNEGMEKYREITSEFDLSVCLNLILKLQEDFGSMEQALDEYLFCLQAGLDLTLYIADKEEYLKLREEKNALINSNEIITTVKIEEKMLESLRKRNEAGADSGTGTTAALPGADSGEAMEIQGADVPAPDADITGLKNIIPENPADALRNEIDILDPMKTLDGGLN